MLTAGLINACKETVITSFAGRWSKQPPFGDTRDKTDVLENIRMDRTPVKSANEIASRIVYQCLLSCLDSVAHEAPALRFLDFYSTELARLVRIKWQRVSKDKLIQVLR